jgi:hypothetical protein
MTSADQMAFGLTKNDSLAAARFWNTPSSRSARMPAHEFANEPPNHSSAVNVEPEGQDSRRVRFAANRGLAAPTHPLSQEYQYTDRDQWHGTDFQLHPESDD